MNKSPANHDAIQQHAVMAGDNADTSPPAPVTPRQSNYDGYTVPGGLSDLKHLPLYLVVAHWGWRRGRAFCRKDLAVAFGISTRRAGDVMSYIRRADSNRVKSQQYHECLAKGVRQRYLRILSAPPTTVPTGRPPQGAVVPQAPVMTCSSTETALEELRQWFLYGRARPGQE
jgi:hypothetical protein